MSQSSSTSNSAYVGVSTHAIEEGTLRALLAKEGGYYFLTWPHTTSGIITRLPKALSPEGRMFSATRELRWQRRSNGYELLLLSNAGSWDAFEALEGNWQCCDRPAALFPKTETRFSGRIRYPEKDVDGKKLKFGQRYFFDAQTATVHFVALTAQPAKNNAPPAAA